MHPKEIWRQIVAESLLKASHTHDVHQLIYYSVYANWDATTKGRPLYWFPSRIVVSIGDSFAVNEIATLSACVKQRASLPRCLPGDPKAIPWTQLSPIRCAADTWAHIDTQVRGVYCGPTNLRRDSGVTILGTVPSLVKAWKSTVYKRPRLGKDNLFI
ncbi:hypothetical protein DVH24_042109 [Malus domestica]|uniref:Uncharacterized protein n=1 Tax=Malus domestica TaxID=3750 RepID=A0A498IVI4_MALDO|nr:hypothetical protein DVH24_042109 [Malus domestica]